MDQKQQPPHQQYPSQPSQLPEQYSASAPTEYYPAPPPQYSVVDPAFQHQPYAPFSTQQQQPQPQLQPLPQVQHIVVYQTPFERHPVNATCPSCHANIVTKVKSEASIYTHVVAGIFCFLCWLPCALLPYCIDSCQNSIHYCPNCAAYIGSYRLGQGRRL